MHRHLRHKELLPSQLPSPRSHPLEHFLTLATLQPGILTSLRMRSSHSCHIAPIDGPPCTHVYLHVPMAHNLSRIQQGNFVSGVLSGYSTLWGLQIIVKETQRCGSWKS